MAFVLNKIVSATYQPLIMDDRTVQDLLFEASALISRLGTSEIPISERAKEILTEARALIGKAIFNSAEAVRLSSSSLTSTGSLGDRLAVRDKEDYLYTYPWVSRDSGVEKGQPNAIWARGNNFRSWAEHPHRRLPLPQSGLNCWEAVSILLYLYHAVTKEDIRTAYRSANYTRSKMKPGFQIVAGAYSS